MGTERKLLQAMFEIFKTSKKGDLLMDSPKVKSWWELKAYEQDKEYALEGSSKGHVTSTSGEGCH